MTSDSLLARREREITSHIDEGNIAFLGLISVQERIPEGFTRWDLEFDLQGRRASITCRGNPDYGGVPHGLDNDVSLAVLVLYQRFGCPADGVIVTTAYQLLKLMGLDTSGYYYKALERSLGRLTHTTYTAREAWREDGRWESKQFRYLEKVHATGVGEGLDNKTVLKIELGKEIAASVRARYIKPLDLELLASLKRPPTRGLYRLLDGRRFAEGGTAVRTFEVGLLEWADVCKILDKRPEKIRRTLQGAHEELIQHGYLEAVEYVGRGKNQRIRYHFAPLARMPDPAGVELLLAQGLSLSVAQRYAREYDLEHLRARVALYTAILEQGYRPRNRPGFLVDVIRDTQGKYANPEGFARQARPAARGRAAVQEGGEGEAEALAAWKAMSSEERMSHLKTVCGMVFKRHFTPRDFELLFEALDEGRLEAEAFYRELLAHSAPRKAAALAARLRAGFEG